MTYTTTIPAAWRHPELAELWTEALAAGWSDEQLDREVERALADEPHPKSPHRFLRAVLRSRRDQGPPLDGAAPCPVPGDSSCGRIGCPGLAPGEVTEYPGAVLAERRPDEPEAAWVRRIRRIARERDLDRAARVRASSAARLELDTLGLDPDSWAGHIPPAWQRSPHGWAPAGPVQLRVRQTLLRAVSLAYGFTDDPLTERGS